MSNEVYTMNWNNPSEINSNMYVFTCDFEIDGKTGNASCSNFSETIPDVIKNSTGKTLVIQVRFPGTGLIQTTNVIKTETGVIVGDLVLTMDDVPVYMRVILGELDGKTHSEIFINKLTIS